MRGAMMITFLEIIQSTVDFIMGFIPRQEPSIEKVIQTKIIAHRGWFESLGVLENTFAAFDPCLEEEVFGMEFDIRWTKDLVPVVHHDASLKRIFGVDLNLSEIDFATLRQKCPEVPTLAEVVERYGKKIHLLIELKKEIFPNPSEQRKILDKVLSPLKELEDYHVLSLYPETFKVFTNFSKKAMIVVSTINPRAMSAVVTSQEYGGLMGHFVLMSSSILKKHHEIKVGTGFPKNKSSFFREMNRDGIEWIFTNHPEIYLNYRKMRLKNDH